MKAVLFDLDGTLTDPFEGITRSIQHALEHLAIQPIPTQRELARFIGPPLRQTFATLLGDRAAGDGIQRAVALYRERFSTMGLFENHVYDGVEWMLGELSRGCRLYIATSKPRIFAERIVRHFHLEGFFAGIYGDELDGRFEDKGNLLEHLLAQEQVAANTAIMVGDREHDVRAARRNGLRSIGVTWGYGHAEELSAAGADWICGSPRDVVQSLSG